MPRFPAGRVRSPLPRGGPSARSRRQPPASAAPGAGGLGDRVPVPAGRRLQVPDNLQPRAATSSRPSKAGPSHKTDSWEAGQNHSMADVRTRCNDPLPPTLAPTSQWRPPP
ncbi:BAG family molecular chaperone regulator 4-like [Phyllostomus discolor]|uniref:BAG family molecular chaperone regulator 4-like n=1 Tax=Phyllostomus discolor TaxID=89673 RepID=A0A7E6D2I9_9CHIR|nr:BAG family molecular chaperone regulator 4-like [Phyllostomus discolor]